jgi:hypothetical protein
LILLIQQEPNVLFSSGSLSVYLVTQYLKFNISIKTGSIDFGCQIWEENIKLTVVNSEDEISKKSDDEAILSILSKDSKNLKQIKAKNFLDILFEIISENI